MLIAPAMAALGIHAHVAAQMTPAEADGLRGSGVVCHHLPDRSRYDPRLALDLASALRRARPDAAFMWLTPMIIAGGAVSTLLGQPWINVECCSGPNYTGRVKETLRQFVGRRAAAIVANSPEGIALWAGHPSRHIVLNALDDVAIRGRRTHAPPGRRMLLSLCRLHPQKRVDLVLRAFAAAAIDDMDLAVVGDGIDRGRLERLAAELGISSRVRFHGHRTDVADWLASADMFASASEFEGQPNAVIEAAAAGLPLILSDIPAHRAIVGEGVVADMAAMARAITHNLGTRATPDVLTPTAAAKSFAAVARTVTQPASAPRRPEHQINSRAERT